MKFSLPETQTKITLSIYFYLLVIPCPRVPFPPSLRVGISPTNDINCAGCTGGFGGTGGMGSRMRGMDEDEPADYCRWMRETCSQAQIESRSILWCQVPKFPLPN